MWGRQGRPPPARVPGRRVKPGAPVTQQPRAGWPPRAARSPVEMIHHTEQHQGVDHHLLHRQLRHRDSARPPAGPGSLRPTNTGDRSDPGRSSRPQRLPFRFDCRRRVDFRSQGAARARPLGRQGRHLEEGKGQTLGINAAEEA